MPFGYLGTTPNQKVKNSGVFSVSEALQVQKDGEWGGSLQLIEEQTVSNVSAVDFTSIQEAQYDVHFMTVTNFQPASDNHYIAYRLYESGTLETAAVYQQARQYGIASGTFGESKSTGIDEVTVSHATGTDNEETNNCYIYFYNLGNSAKYSFSTSQSSGVQAGGSANFEFAGAVLPQTSTVDGIRILTDQGSNIEHATIKLYGVKQI